MSTNEEEPEPIAPSNNELTDAQRLIIGSEAHLEENLFNEKGKPDLEKIVEKIKERETFVTFRDNESIYYFKDGIYVRNGETRIKELVHELLEGKETTQQVNEIIGKIQRSTYIDRSIFTDNNEHKIVVENGILNLETLELSPHSHGFYSLTKFPVIYDSTKKCDKILKFLSETVKPGDVPTLQEWVGYNLWTTGYPAQKAMILVGEGGNGKSTFIGFIEALIGRENRSSVSLQELEENRFASHDLYGKAANLYPDLPDKDLRSTGKFKMLTGGDPIRAENKHVKAFTFRNYAKLTFSCNKIPRVYDDTTAFFRRFIIIEFPNCFEGSDKEDRDLKEKITSDKDEMSGFLNWALDGLARLRANGWHFSDNKTVEEVKEEYTVMSNPYKAFVDHCVIQDSDLIAPKDKVYEAYKKHCDKHKMGNVSRDSFFKNLKDIFPPDKLITERPEINGKRVYAFRGIGIRDESKWCTPLTEDEIDVFRSQSGGREGRHSGQDGQGILTDVQGVQGENDKEAGQSAQNENNKVQGVHSVQGETPLLKIDSPNSPHCLNMLSEPENSQSLDINPCTQLALEDLKAELKTIMANNGNMLSLSIFFDTLKEKLKTRCPGISDSEIREAFKIATGWAEFVFDYNLQIVTLKEAKQ